MGHNLVPKISVLLPVFNGELYLEKAIQSILDQTFTDYEFLIIDDGSTDDTEAIIKGFSDKRIVYIKKEHNQGIVACLNEGIGLAKGEFIARMDADDIALPIRFQRQYDFLLQNAEIAVIGSHFQLMNASGMGKRSYFMPLTHEALKVKLLFGSPFAHPTVMLRKMAFLDHQLYYREEFKHVEDYDLWSRALPLLKGANYDEVLLHYRISDSQVGSKFSAVQQQLDNSIKRRQLAAFPLSESEINLLSIFFQNGVHLDQVYYFKEICATLKKLSHINAELNLLNVGLLNQEISHKLDNIVNVYSNAKNKLYRSYKQSYFFNWSQFSLKQHLKIWFKQYSSL